MVCMLFISMFQLSSKITDADLRKTNENRCFRPKSKVDHDCVGMSFDDRPESERNTDNNVRALMFAGTLQKIATKSTADSLYDFSF